MSGPPPALIASLVQGPSLVTEVRWFDECDTTNGAALEAAASGAAEGLLVIADQQRAGRGRHGRSWVAPPGTSLLFSLLLRPPPASHRLLPLLTGLVVAETVARHLPDADIALKWPNDLLVDGRKAAGILAEAADGAVVVGVGVNVDWREVDRPEALRAATSLAEAAGQAVDRWRVLAGLLGVFSRRYAQWLELPAAFLDGYRQRCVTIGRDVRVDPAGGESFEAFAVDVDADGALRLRTGDGELVTLHAGDVHHLRPTR